MHSSSVLVLGIFLLVHFALRLYKVLWFYNEYLYVSPCDPEHEQHHQIHRDSTEEPAEENDYSERSKFLKSRSPS